MQDYAHLPLVARGRVSAKANTVGGVILNVWDSEHVEPGRVVPDRGVIRR
jgi:hypothetical protein